MMKDAGKGRGEVLIAKERQSGQERNEKARPSRIHCSLGPKFPDFMSVPDLDSVPDGFFFFKRP